MKYTNLWNRYSKKTRGQGQEYTPFTYYLYFNSEKNFIFTYKKHNSAGSNITIKEYFSKEVLQKINELIPQLLLAGWLAGWLGCNIEVYQDHILCYISQTKGLHGLGFLI